MSRGLHSPEADARRVRPGRLGLNARRSPGFATPPHNGCAFVVDGSMTLRLIVAPGGVT